MKSHWHLRTTRAFSMRCASVREYKLNLVRTTSNCSLCAFNSLISMAAATLVDTWAIHAMSHCRNMKIILSLRAAAYYFSEKWCNDNERSDFDSGIKTSPAIVNFGLRDEAISNFHATTNRQQASFWIIQWSIALNAIALTKMIQHRTNVTSVIAYCPNRNDAMT